MESLPTPPNEDLVRPQAIKKPHGNSKSLKTVPRALKRSSPHSHPPSPARETHHHHGDGRHKRVWKACERCRMKKTKCDGEFPCKRCKDDGLICTAGTRKKTEYKQLPPGYAEVLENTQFVLVATVQKLYSMVRNGDTWDLGDPELNDRGQPVVHNVAAKLGCLRPNNDLDLPVHSIFPEDEAGMAELARQLREHNAATAAARAAAAAAASGAAGSPPSVLLSQSTAGRIDPTYQQYPHADRAASSSPASDADHSDFDGESGNYRRSAFGPASSSSTLSMSPASLSLGELDVSPPVSTLPSSTGSFNAWMSGPQQQQQQQRQEQQQQQQQQQQQIWMASQGFLDTDMVGGASGLLAGSGFGMKMHPSASSSSCRNPSGVMMGMADPMIYSGYDEDPLLRPLFANPANI
ncbi:hypothetical protein VTJ83DRAFT_1772 [Remersonia thermophila]|uniref:Zn(2)-C6 fungal-type domain-containing protein n=1 Tax=Remersonia thermophila TaxID=72144 RepID=A0ABR4DGV5_9PEZI